MIVLGLLYNNNGMATWCTEAAYAFYNAGKDFILVIDTEQRPDLKNHNFPFKTLEWKFEKTEFPASKAGKAISILKRSFSGESTGFASGVSRKLKEKGITPSLFLLNQTDLQDTACTIPQYVVAWAYPPTLSGYLVKTVNQTPSLADKKIIFSLLGAFTWYFKDWRAYREATGVLAVTNRLSSFLNKRGINARRVYPPLKTKVFSYDYLPKKKIRIIFAALDLENPQKKIEWGLECLSTFQRQDEVEIHLIGKYSYLKEKFSGGKMNTVFHGQKSREEAVALMEQGDIFVFCSSFDDWGYVQVEAMSKGMAIMAPAISPCDEIVGNKDFLYTPGNKTSFLKTLNKLVDKQTLNDKIQYCLDRSTMFNHDQFMKQLEGIV